eukprot:Hpha_TRINITY_DN34432_c0_g1::TRINITY_DN34432_c0_g1_i1::g.96056::m.96056
MAPFLDPDDLMYVPPSGAWQELFRRLLPHSKEMALRRRIADMYREHKQSGRVAHFDVQDLGLGDEGIEQVAEWLRQQCPRSEESCTARRVAVVGIMSLLAKGISGDVCTIVGRYVVREWVARGVRSIVLHGNGVGYRGLAAVGECLKNGVEMESIACGRGRRSSENWEGGIAAVARAAQRRSNDCTQALALYVGPLSASVVNTLVDELIRLDERPIPVSEFSPSVELRAWADSTVYAVGNLGGMAEPTWRDLARLQEVLPQRTLAVGSFNDAGEAEACLEWCREKGRDCCARVSVVLFGDVSGCPAEAAGGIVQSLSPKLCEVRFALQRPVHDPGHWAAVITSVAVMCAETRPSCAVTVAVDPRSGLEQELKTLAGEVVGKDLGKTLRVIWATPARDSAWSGAPHWRTVALMHQAAPRTALDLSGSVAVGLQTDGEQFDSLRELCSWMESVEGVEVVSLRSNELGGGEIAMLMGSLPRSCRYIDLRGNRGDKWARGVVAACHRLVEKAPEDPAESAGGVNIGNINPEDIQILSKEIRSLPHTTRHVEIGFRCGDAVTWRDMAELRTVVPPHFDIPVWPRGKARAIAEWLRDTKLECPLWELVTHACEIANKDDDSLLDLESVLPVSVRRIDIGTAPQGPPPIQWARGAAALACALRSRKGGRLVVNGVSPTALLALVAALQQLPPPPHPDECGRVRIVCLHSSGLAHAPSVAHILASRRDPVSHVLVQVPLDIPPVPCRGWPWRASLWMSIFLFSRLSLEERSKVLQCIHGGGQRLGLEEVDGAPVHIVAPLLATVLRTRQIARIQLSSLWWSDSPFERMRELLAVPEVGEALRAATHVRRLEVVSYG